MANAIWIDQGTFLLTDFRYAIEEQFKSKLGILNFEMTPNALSTINNWISEQTQGKIPNLLNPNDIDQLTRLVLTNAVYFQGAWVSPFNPKASNVAPFHPTPETSVNVKMMHQTFFTSYYENGLMQALSLPFTGVTNGDSNLAFLLLLPKSADNFSTMIDEFSKSYSEWISSLRPFNIALSLPKFTFSSRYDLQKPLQDLGMQDPFGSNANFTGIDGMRDLFLNKVVHQAFFALDENGVTAAAATAASMNVTSALPSEPPIQFVADHPFLFLIIDLKSQEIFIHGKSCPTQRHQVKQKLALKYFGISDIGLVRSNNEDVWSAVADKQFFILADGMGGHNAGEVASSFAVESMCKSIDALPDLADVEKVSQFLREAIAKANSKVFNASRKYPDYAGMGTTLSCFIVIDKFLVYGHIGDSRLYRYRNQLEQLTEDHSLRQPLWNKEEKGSPPTLLMLFAM